MPELQIGPKSLEEGLEEPLLFPDVETKQISSDVTIRAEIAALLNEQSSILGDPVQLIDGLPERFAVISRELAQRAQQLADMTFLPDRRSSVLTQLLELYSYIKHTRGHDGSYAQYIQSRVDAITHGAGAHPQHQGDQVAENISSWVHLMVGEYATARELLERAAREIAHPEAA